MQRKYEVSRVMLAALTFATVLLRLSLKVSTELPPGTSQSTVAFKIPGEEQIALRSWTTSKSTGNEDLIENLIFCPDFMFQMMVLELPGSTVRDCSGSETQIICGVRFARCHLAVCHITVTTVNAINTRNDFGIFMCLLRVAGSSDFIAVLA